MKIKSTKFSLNKVQIIVRYCSIEEPYWNAFINHYYSLDVRIINIIVQNKKDIISLKRFNYPNDLDLYFFESKEKDPNKALINFNLNLVKNKSKYTLLLDCDEFIYCFNDKLDFSKLLDKKKSLNIRWLINPLTNKKSLSSGFYGTECKQIAISNRLIRIQNCHKFDTLDNQNNEEEATIYGIVLLHNWSRSLIDCLLKSSYSKIKNEKTVDQKNIVKNLKNGKLNSRAKYLAFLDIQNRYIVGINDNYIKLFNYQKEQELIMEKFSDVDIKLFFELYQEYKLKLIRNLQYLENFPPFDGNIISQMKRFNSKVFSTKLLLMDSMK